VQVRNSNADNVDNFDCESDSFSASCYDETVPPSVKGKETAGGLEHLFKIQPKNLDFSSTNSDINIDFIKTFLSEELAQLLMDRTTIHEHVTDKELSPHARPILKKVKCIHFGLCT
jgi:hypothetical protein